jgi:hypothetical protein
MGSKRRLEAVFRVGLDQKLADEAISEVNKYLNDYTRAGPLAKNIIKPYLIPFWSFYRHAVKTIVTMPFEHPGKAVAARAFQTSMEARMKADGVDPEALPPWMMDGAFYSGHTSAGEARFVSTAGLNPFNTALGSPMQLMNPMLKVAFEDSTGRSMFTGKEFTDPNVVSGGFGVEQRYRIETINGKQVPVPIEKTAPGIVEHLLQQIPQYELAKDVIAGGSTYDSTTLLDAIRYRMAHQGQAPVIDPATGEPYNPKDAVGALEKMFGYTTYNVDAEKAAKTRLQQEAAALKAWYARHGVTGASGGGGLGG